MSAQERGSGEDENHQYTRVLRGSREARGTSSSNAERFPQSHPKALHKASGPPVPAATAAALVSEEAGPGPGR